MQGFPLAVQTQRFERLLHHSPFAAVCMSNNNAHLASSVVTLGALLIILHTGVSGLGNMMQHTSTLQTHRHSNTHTDLAGEDR